MMESMVWANLRKIDYCSLMYCPTQWDCRTPWRRSFQYKYNIKHPNQFQGTFSSCPCFRVSLSLLIYHLTSLRSIVKSLTWVNSSLLPLFSLLVVYSEILLSVKSATVWRIAINIDCVIWYELVLKPFRLPCHYNLYVNIVKLVTTLC